MVVPSTVCRERDDWCEDLQGDRDPGRRMGELDGVIFRDAPAPGLLLLVNAFAIASAGDVSSLSPGSAGVGHFRAGS